MVNGLTYVLERREENGKLNELRAHHNQLRKWREPPLYPKNHPVYELCRIRTTEMEREINDTGIDSLKETGGRSC